MRPGVFGENDLIMAAERTIRPNRTGAATRGKIVEAAIAVLAERGFSGFTLQAVADRAGVLFGSVTHHYGTRDRLIEAMLDAILAAIPVPLRRARFGRSRRPGAR